MPAVPEEAPASIPEEHYRRAAAAGRMVYTIDPAASLVQIFVYRDGALAHLGHDHVIAGRDVRGFVIRDSRPSDGAVLAEGHLYMPLAALTVDEPALRAAAGFEKTISESARLGTKSNMLESLDARQFPFVTLYVTTGIDSEAATSAAVAAAINLHGVTNSIEIPVQVTVDADTLAVSGEFSLHQADFGIERYTALGGALAVMDRLDLAFSVRAKRLEADRH